MTRNELIEKLTIQALEDFSNMSLEEMDCAYQNLLEDFFAKCDDGELVQRNKELAE